MSKPHLCPKCNGECSVEYETETSGGTGKRTCPVCLGAGVLWEPSSNPYEPPPWYDPYDQPNGWVRKGPIPPAYWPVIGDDLLLQTTCDSTE